ncbi:hypothetical protein DV736_g4328, partial [Chaetothyriales sp. CBS 134916]
MASTARPSPLAPKSFQRYEPPQPPPALRSRAATGESSEGDDASDGIHNGANSDARAGKSRSRLAKFDELPIELATLTDGFVDSLSVKVHSEPPTIDSISALFQDFYAGAAVSIATHISALLSRLNRRPSPAQSGINPGARARAAHTRDTKDGQQLLTPSEVTEKRRARRLLEYKRVLLSEAVEKRACEKVYDKIWRHKSTLDDVRDEKLRSKTAALALVGIGLKDLGIRLGDGDSNKATATLDHIQQSLAPARDGLARMNDERSPLGKLQHLQAAHKAIVDTLCTIHPSGSSADEILPTLIYTLITSPVQGINIISNLCFIQRFRAASKIDGEAAYCMTNLEAAIAFLENVDLASLRGDETGSGLGKDSQPGTPVHAQAEPEPAVRLPLKTSPASRASTSASPSAATATGTNAEPSAALARRALEPTSKALPSVRSQRTLSDLLQPITTAPAAARRTAEESIETMSSTLDNSFKFLFSRLREKSADESNAEVIVPKTLDEARQLVNRPLTPDEADTISDNSSLAERDEDNFSASINNPISQIGSAFGGALRSFGGQRSVANDLTVGDLPVLLHDYQRLARLLDNLRLMGLEEQDQDQDQERRQG